MGAFGQILCETGERKVGLLIAVQSLFTKLYMRPLAP